MQRYKKGRITIFVNEKDYITFSVVKSYVDRTGSWKKTNNYFFDELETLGELIKQVKNDYAYLKKQEGRQNDADW